MSQSMRDKLGIRSAVHPDHFQWSAFDRNRCDTNYHNGQQVRFLRQQPVTVSGGWAAEGWFARFIEKFWRAG